MGGRLSLKLSCLRLLHWAINGKSLTFALTISGSRDAGAAVVASPVELGFSDLILKLQKRVIDSFCTYFPILPTTVYITLLDG